MKILYVNPFSQEVSGPDESLLALIPELAHLGIEAEVVLPHPGPYVERYRRAGAGVHFAPMSRLERRPRLADLALLGLRFARGAAAIARIARRVRADLVHTNMETVLDGAAAARLCGLPHVLHYRGNTLDEPRLVFDALVRLWTATSRKVFCISHATAAIFEKRGREVEVVYNPVDVAAFGHAQARPEVRAQLGAGPDELLIGTAGRIHPRKALEVFVRAAAELARDVASARFVVVGAPDGEYERSYQASVAKLAGELGLDGRLRFAGPRHDMGEVLKAMDVFVLSSRHEGFGRVVAEAMAAGRPLVVSREGALPELVRHGREGWCATPGDPLDFAAWLRELCRNPALRASMGRAGVKRARRFDATEIAERVAWTYRALVAR